MPLFPWPERSFLTYWKIHPLTFASNISLVKPFLIQQVALMAAFFMRSLLDTDPLLMDVLTICPSVLPVIISLILGRSPIQFLFIISCLAQLWAHNIYKYSILKFMHNSIPSLEIFMIFLKRYQNGASVCPENMLFALESLYTHPQRG